MLHQGHTQTSAYVYTIRHQGLVYLSVRPSVRVSVSDLNPKNLNPKNLGLEN